jgi:hypothetical protein
MTLDVQSDCLLFGNERQQQTLAPTAPDRPCRAQGIATNVTYGNAGTLSAITPPQLRLSIVRHPGSGEHFNSHIGEGSRMRSGLLPNGVAMWPPSAIRTGRDVGSLQAVGATANCAVILQLLPSHYASNSEVGQFMTWSSQSENPRGLARHLQRHLCDTPCAEQCIE